MNGTSYLKGNTIIGEATAGTNHTLTLNGHMVINPSYNTSNSYSEGIRINKDTNNWSVIALGGDVGSTSGTNAKTWLIGDYDGIFYLSLNGSDSAATRFRGSGNGFIAYPRLGVNGENTSYNFYVNGTSYFNGNTTHNGIDYFANGTTYYINNSAEGNLNWLKLNRVSDHGLQVGTIRGMAVGSQTGEYIHMYERVHIGAPGGWGSRNAPSYGLSTYGGAWFATDTGVVNIGNTSNTNYKFYVNGTSYFNGNVTHNGITYFANGTTYSINNSADATLRRGNFRGTSDSNTAASDYYHTGALEIRESNYVGNGQSAFAYAPRIGFHWANRIAASLSFHSDGIFYLRTQNGVDRASLDANLIGNAATATAVKDRQTGTITYLNYGASALTSTSWLAAWNGYELRAISPKVVQDLVQHSRNVTVDLSSLDNSKWFPVTGTSLPTFGYNKIKVSVQLNSGTVPSWSTHASGFTCNMELYVTAAGWGTTGGETIVLASSYSFASVDPCGFQQQSYNSMPVLWLRGGGKYFVETDFDCTWTVRTSSYDTYNSGDYVQTVAPTTTYPGIQGINGTIKAGKVYGAVWNDYAEYRSTSKVKPGQCVVETGLGDLIQSTKRLQPGANIVSDTFGFAIGETEQTKTPLAVSGRVLAYPYEDRYSYSAGDPVCSGPNGTISKMTREEVCKYPDRIVGTVSEIPEYETWGTGNVKVDGRIWIKVR